jgi:hypothetical protein
VPDAVGDSAQSEPQKEATQMIADAIETGPEDPGLGTGIEVTEATPDPVSSPESQEQHNDIVAALAPPPPPPPSPSLLLLKRSTASGLTGNRNRAESPTKSLKPLFWDKLGPSNVGHGTIWSDLVDAQPLEEVQKGIACDIQRLIAKHPKSGLSMRASTLSRANSVRQTVALIDLTKAKNMEIVLARVRLQPDELRDAILQMDETKLRNSDIVRTLIDIAPSPEDLATVSAYKGDVVRLGLAEKHILALGSIAHLKERLSAMAFQQRFDLEIAELLPDLATSRRACSEVYQSQLLKQTLALVLYAGNILYESTLRGDAHGFQLASLLKLAEMKSTLTGKSETTLLQYLVATHEKVVGHRVDFTAELPHCAAASKISSTLFRNNVAQLENKLRHAKEQVDCVSSSQVAENDVFAAKMKPFLEHASQIVERVASNAAALQDQQRALLLYLGEESSTPIEQVFATLATVMRLLQSASDANVQQTE